MGHVPGTLVMTFSVYQTFNKFSGKQFPIFISIFLFYFLLFVTVIYPNRDTLEPVATTASYSNSFIKLQMAQFNVQKLDFHKLLRESELWSNIIFFHHHLGLQTK